jgi:intracellular septation protein A
MTDSPSPADPTTTTAATATPLAVSPAAKARALLKQPGILLGVAAPFVVYQVATTLGVSDLAALAWGAVFPLAGIAVGLARTRRLDAISAISLISIVVGLVGGLVLHSAEFLLVKDSLVTATIGLAFLGSLLASRPLIFTIGRAQAPERTDVFDRRWAEPAFRHALRSMTAVWGVTLLAEASARISLSLLIPHGVLLLVSPLLAAVFIGPVAIWTMRRRARLRSAAADRRPLSPVSAGPRIG